MAKEFNYHYDPNGINEVFDEKGNNALAIRVVSWDGEDGTHRLDIRKYTINKDNEEICGKGVSFLTPNGPNELVRVLTVNGYGNTEEILNSIKDREDFRPALNNILGPQDPLYDNSISNPENIYVPGSNLFGGSDE